MQKWAAVVGDSLKKEGIEKQGLILWKVKK